MTDQAPMQRVVCGLCGSPEVVVEAYARWDEAAQDWIVAMLWAEVGHCHACGDTSAAWEIIGANAEGHPS